MAWRRWKQWWQVQRQMFSMDFWGEQCYIPLYPQPPPPHRKVCHTPSAPSGIHRTWCLWTCRPGNEGCLYSCSSSFRGGHPHPYATPLHSAGGCQMSIPMPGWGLQGGSINLPCYYLHTCMQSAPGGGVGVPLLQQVLLQSRHFLGPQEKPF